MADFGYDVSDYVDIDPVFGTLQDVDDLLAAVHGRGKYILQLNSTLPMTRNSRFFASDGI